MAEPRKPNFMKLSIAKPAEPASFTDEEKSAAAQAAAGGGVLAGTGNREQGTGNSEFPVPSSQFPVPCSNSPAHLLARADESASFIREKLGAARIAVVLGSGLGGFADGLEGASSLDYAQIPHFPRSTVVGHKGRLVIGRASGTNVLALQGRFHYYEGYALDEVTFPVRVLARLGVRLLVITNAAGGISEGLAAGDLMVIEDHLNLMGVNPLRGPHDDRFGARFPDMSEVWAPRFRERLLAAAPSGVTLKKGVYAALSGPSYETPAEIRMLARLGADAVGMSTVPEAIVAAQMGLGVCGISGIANMAAGIVRGHRLTHAEVVETMNRVGGTFAALLANALPGLDEAIGA